jgi:L-lactate dehydrogenase complex protein LldF
MLTEECRLNEYLEEREITVINSDLGEYIQQIDEEPRAILYFPAFIKGRRKLANFSTNTSVPKRACRPYIADGVARKHLRNIFITRRAALTGVNFAVAENWEYVVCTNEGNADMGAHLSEVQIASMGLEK